MRSAMLRLRSSLHSLDASERAELRDALDQADEDMRPPPPPAPPKPFAAVELLDWRFNSSYIQNGSMTQECRTRTSRAVQLGTWAGNDSIQVAVGNLAVDVRLRGHGLFEVQFTPQRSWRGGRPSAAWLVWEFEFATNGGEAVDASLPLTSVPDTGHIRFMFSADPAGWEGGE